MSTERGTGERPTRRLPAADAYQHVRPVRSSSATTSTGSRCTGRCPQQPAQYEYPHSDAQGQGYGYDPYAHRPAAARCRSYDTYDPYGAAGAPAAAAGPAPVPTTPYGAVRGRTGQQQPRRGTRSTATAAHPRRRPLPGPSPPARDARPGRPEYRTEQFSFIEEPDEDSEDVIDWLKFTESRTERREEARRRGRSRVVALVVVLVLCVAGGVGYLWYAGKLPGFGSADPGKGAATPRARRSAT